MRRRRGRDAGPVVRSTAIDGSVTLCSRLKPGAPVPKLSISDPAVCSEANVTPPSTDLRMRM
jgi:hypothetical protein